MAGFVTFGTVTDCYEIGRVPLLLNRANSKGPRRALLESSRTRQILNPEFYVRHGGRT